MAESARKPPTLSEKIEARIARRKGDVFLRADFADLGGYAQVGRDLAQLTRSGKLTKIGYGIYARAGVSPFDGSVIPANGLYRLTEEAFRRLGIRTGLTVMQRAYSEGRTTQVPAGRVIGVDRRVRRKIAFKGASMAYERV
jgi:hypothetical protein